MLDLSNILKFKNKKGQAFSTFQLLIAAVVALALLGVLMPIIMNVLGFAQRDPVSTSKQLLQGQVDNPGTLTYTDSVVFTDKKKSLSSSGISENTGLSPDQVRFVVGDLATTDFVELVDNKGIDYQKSTKGTYKIGIICDYKNNIIESSEAYAEIPDITSITWESTDDIKVCVIFPKRSS